MDARYPIGRYQPPDHIEQQHISEWIEEISHLPGEIGPVVAPLAESQLNQRYREGGWTIRQIVYHLGDSHLNSYVRFKWALTESTPLIKAYDEARWADLPDSNGSVEDALFFLEALHRRWVNMFRSMPDADWDRSFEHPETGKLISLKTNLGLYAWHGRHHLAHITHALSLNPAIF